MSYRHTYIQFYLLIIIINTLTCTTVFQFNILVVTLANSEVLFLKMQKKISKQRAEYLQKQYETKLKPERTTRPIPPPPPPPPPPKKKEGLCTRQLQGRSRKEGLCTRQLQGRSRNEEGLCTRQLQGRYGPQGQWRRKEIIAGGAQYGGAPGRVREGGTPPAQLGGMGERCKLPHRGLGLRPRSQRFLRLKNSKNYAKKWRPRKRPIGLY